MITTRRQLLSGAGATAAALTLPRGASAAGDYPNKPIKIIVAAASGGPTDVPARLASRDHQRRNLASPSWSKTGPAPAARIGARVVATSPPDGYTLLMGNTSTLAVIPAVSLSAGYDPVKDFVPIIRITEGFQILVVHPSSPWKTVKEFVDYTKANPGKINYAHTGAGGLPHLAGELFMLRSGAKMTGVAYRSGGESSNAVLGQAVHATLENIAILRSLISSGKLRGLAVQNKTRTPLLPNVPTMAEAGVPDCEANTFFGLAAPKGTPDNIVKKLSDVINEGLATPEMQKVIVGLGSEAKPNSPAEFAAYIAAQHKKWVEVGKAAHVQVN